MNRALLIALTLLGLMLAVATLYFWKDMQAQLDTPINIQGGSLYTIKSGMSLKSISHDLVRQGILSHPYYFMFEGQLNGYQSRIKAGEYLISADITARQLLKEFVTGKVQQHALTLIEGSSYKQVMQAIHTNDILIKLLPHDADGQTVMQLLGYPNIHPEGNFFPETYHFPAGTTDIDFLRRAYLTMRHVLEEEWQNREGDLPYKTHDEALILASIIEKEAILLAEHPTIAGVFVRRLKKGMKLQADPTVIYAMGDIYQGNISRKDLRLDSPYNTYVYKGLPPTPIALASRTAIHAALHPQPGDTLYFVAKGDRTHYFSKTLKEHNKAVNKYQR